LSREPNPLKRFFKMLGPGLVTGASDDDPSGIGTYAMAGASLGYATLWTALVTFPLMAAVQFICAKVGMVTRRGLAGVLREHYPRFVLYPAVTALLVANVLNAGVDIGAIASGFRLLHVPLGFEVLAAACALLVLALQVFAGYRFIARVFKWLTLALFAYIGSAFCARPQALAVLAGTFVPTLHWNAEFLMTLVAILGTTISPYLFFWQASQEVEEQQARGGKRFWRRKGPSDADLQYAAWDVNAGMLLSNVVMYFIILASAATLHEAGLTDIQTADQAAEALRPLAGPAASILMALGLIGAGFLAVPILVTSAAYAVCEAFGWRTGLDHKPQHAPSFYVLILASMLVGMGLNFVGLDPIRALFWVAVINGFLTPPFLLLLMLISNNRRIMGGRVNSRLLNVLGWATTLAMFAAAAGLVLTWGQQP
jgi:NRAMP (natural resistance-associated macrophage protein)-like metal ion transporter